MTATDSGVTVPSVAEAQAAVRAAEYAFEQTIRDEVDKGTSIADIAETLGDRRRRQRVYAILERGDGDAHQPAPQSVVYLRGRGQPQDIWERVERAMWARGWRTVKDRTQAFHLARGGCPVVLADFTSEHVGLAVDWITVGRVRARYEEEVTTRSVADLLTTEDRVQLMREGAEWLDRRVDGVTIGMDLPLVTGGRVDRPRRRADRITDRTLDEQRLARMVAEHFDN